MLALCVPVWWPECIGLCAHVLICGCVYAYVHACLYVWGGSLICAICAYVLSLLAGVEPDMCSYSGVCKWKKDTPVHVGQGVCVAESCLLWGLQLTLGLVSDTDEVPSRAQPKPVWPLQISLCFLLLRQRFM